jgi:iron-sulfur cluster repair protein YtfE (RIC family)
MSWLEGYHEDHMAVLLLLEKMEGNIRYMEAGQAGPNMIYDFKEFGDVLREVIIPHFKNEEEGIYPSLAKINAAAKSFVDAMLADHAVLYKAFDEFLGGLEQSDLGRLTAAGRQIIPVLRKHIHKEEELVPELARKAGIVQE